MRKIRRSDDFPRPIPSQTVAGVQASCTTAYTNTQKALDDWAKSFNVNYTDACTPEEIDELKGMVGDISALRSATFSLAEGYATDSTNRVTRLTTYSSAVASYNEEYVDNKTSGLLVGVTDVIDSVSVPHLAVVNLSFASMSAMVK